MGVLKFLDEQDGQRHQGPLNWGSLVGNEFSFPFRGPAEPLRKQDLDRVQTNTDFCFRNFDLEDPEDMLEYRAVMDRVVSGWFVVIDRSKWVNPATGSVKIYLEWGQRYNEVTRPTDRST